MASEAIEILIAADDKASSKLKTVGGNVEDLGRRVKDAGGKLKSSAELAKVFAGSFGGGAFGSFAGDLGQITERVSAFSDVAKGGGAGAVALKAGLSAAVALVSFKVGQTIGDWAFETKKWTKEMEAAEAQARKLNAAVATAQQKQFANVRQDIDLIGDPGEREAARKARESQLRMEEGGVEKAKQNAERMLEIAEKRKNAWSVAATLQRSEMQRNVQAFQEQLDQQKERLAAIREERMAFEQMNGERAKEIEALKASNESKAKSQSFIEGLREEVAMLKASTDERLKMEAAKNTTPQQSGLAVELLKERDALKAKAEAEKEAQKQAEDARRAELAAAEKVQDLQQKELAKLEEKRILLTQGTEAARQFALQQQGLSAAAAAAIASEEAKLQQTEGRQKFEADHQPLQALESRLMSRGTGGDPQAMLARDTAKIAAQSSEQVKSLQELIKQQSRVIDALKGLPKIEMVHVY